MTLTIEALNEAIDTLVANGLERGNIRIIAPEWIKDELSFEINQDEWVFLPIGGGSLSMDSIYLCDPNLIQPRPKWWNPEE